MEVCRSKAMAELKLVHYAAAVKAMEVADRMGVKLKRYTEGREEFWQIVLVDRKET